jgi:hypothetical protein
MHYLKLLIPGIIGNMRGKGVNVLLIFKHQQFKLICAYTSVLNNLLIIIRQQSLLTLITKILLHVNLYAWRVVMESTLRKQCMPPSIIQSIVS